jgi:aryl-alcohol dehydrogenase
VLVRLVATGVCHTDVLVRDDPAPVQLPTVPGHEGSGTVIEVGSAVTGLAAGDKVVLTWDSCGTCRHCLAAKPAFCDQMGALNRNGYRTDGSSGLSEAGKPVGGHFFGQSSFATHSLTRARNTIKLPADTSLEELRLLGPLGCGVQTGAGAILTAFDVVPGSPVAVWGVGSVGLSAVMAAATRDCHPLVAIDVHPDRLEQALAFGATHVVDARQDDVLDQVLAISPGGVDYAVDTTGVASVVANAARTLATGGQLGLHGRARLGGGLDLAQVPPGRTVSFLIEGQCVPQLFVPQLHDLYRRGQLPFDKMTREYPFEAVNEALSDAASGAAIKPILVF